jgi:hypothetical protein
MAVEEVNAVAVEFDASQVRPGSSVRRRGRLLLMPVN